MESPLTKPIPVPEDPVLLHYRAASGQNRRKDVRLPGVRLVISLVEQSSETIELGRSQ